jgi:hypothetical protein
MSFPFITVVERNERQKKEAANNLSQVDYDIISKNKESPKKEICDKDNMICLSNLDEIVFYPCPRKSIFSKLKYNKPRVDYDKYLDFFE